MRTSSDSDHICSHVIRMSFSPFPQQVAAMCMPDFANKGCFCQSGRVYMSVHALKNKKKLL